MNILNDKSDISFVSAAETEQVQQEEKEYLLLGTFMRTKGLRLFYYNPSDNMIREAEIKYSNTLHIYKMPDNKFITVDWEAQKCTIDSKCIYFEALNYKSAINRVNRVKTGRLRELFNLRRPNMEGIKFF
jgi:hypothetical protein